MEHHHQAQFPISTTTTTTDVHPTAVANATPTLPYLTSNHPSYAEMITAAILWDSSQGKAGGSSKRAIAKYIDRVYTNLPPTHSSLLTHHLKRLKDMGQLVMIKNSYQLPLLAASTTVNTPGPAPGPGPAPATSAVPLRSAPPHTIPVSPTIKKRPGRPPKLSTTTAIASETLAPSVGVGNGPSSTGKRHRGRPPRNLNINLNQTQQQHQIVAEVPFVQVQAQPNYAPDLGLNNGDSQPVKRRAGRPPRKQQQEVVQPISQDQVQGFDQGGGVVVAGNGTVQKRRPGRPPKAGNVSGGPKPKPKGRGRPKRNALGPVVMPIGKKPRGRPPRQLGVASVVGGKRRGRPPKAGLSVVPVAKPARKYTGKTRGRPKKSASTLAKATQEQWMANEELIKKAESMQAKIRDAVSVLKPYFTNSNATDALTTLQQLEDLSTMEITVAPPPNPPVEPPVTAMLLTIQPYDSVPLEATVNAPAAPESTIPAPQADPLPPVMPFSITAPAMTEPAPFYMPPNVGTQQQPTSWIPSGGAHL